VKKPDAKILGIITARGGSKGIPGKNIKELCGKPLIVWSIDAAHGSGVLDRLIISTDDSKIASVAQAHGVEVPFMRPAELAEDSTAHLPVIQHAVRTLREEEGYKPDYVMIFQPTSPLRQARHVREAWNLMRANPEADSVVGVVEIPEHYNPHWQTKVADDGTASIFTGERFGEIIRRRQDLPRTYTRNGGIYILKTRVLFTEPPSLYGEHVLAYVMEPKFSINIDEPADWEEARRMMRLVMKEGSG